MKYVSTRGGIDPISFSQAVMMGLATDGGLLLPEHYPGIDEERLKAWQDLSYPELALEVMGLFIDDIPQKDLEDIIKRSYAAFDTPEVTPLVRLDSLYVLELFHGPTLAFKDVALQFLGNLFSYLLKKEDTKMNILGATSGDTGSAAIYGVRGKENIKIFILHPHGRVSPVQALQMTTVPEKNVFNLAVEGTFDQCQAIVKSIFKDIPFKRKFNLGAINSINWARVLAQVVYYIYSTLKLKKKLGVDAVHFSVPTGNFGDIFAGYVARRMIRPSMEKLILATNENNILAKFVLEGVYHRGKVVHTISPSMDIQVASNFERYLFHLYNENPEKVRRAMTQFETTGEIVFTSQEKIQIKKDFEACAVDQTSTLATIRDTFQKTGYVLDPHTAVGVNAAKSLETDLHVSPIVCLSTAHPAKFPEAVKKAIGKEPVRPDSLKDIEKKESRFVVLPADEEQTKGYIEENALII